MRVTVRKWGNSASVRIPSAIMEAAHLSLDQSVDIREERGRVVIEASQPTEFDLSCLLAGITDGNLHDEVSFGPAVGKEVW